jgi:hypothetical protein
MSQNDQIAAWLQSGKTITPLEALRRFKTMRLAARINNLRDAGMRIKSGFVDHRGKRFAKYWISA